MRVAIEMGLAALLLVGCNGVPGEHVIIVDDVSRPHVFDLTPTNQDMRRISFVRLQFDGYLDGVAHLALNGYDTQKLSGTTHLVYGQDVSATNYIITYIPERVTTGTLSLRYTFQ